MGNQIELRHLHYFLAVAEELHFRKAAERLFISQPGLSRQIKQLEESLETRLFTRNNRKVQLTSAGVYLKKETQLHLKHLDQMLKHTKLIDAGLEGQLNLGYVGSAMQNFIPNLLLKFRNLHPTIHFKLAELDNQKQIESLISHDIDLGFIRLDRVPKGLYTKTVFEDTFSLVLPSNHKINKDNFKGLFQLKEAPFILFEKSYSPAYFEKVMQLFEESDFQPIVSHTSVNASTIFRLVENNFGISIVPTSLQLGYAMDIKFIELVDVPQRTVLSAVWNSENRNPVLQKILELL
ncbi:MAG: LysR family transcriptional regulator [Flavobacteriaceae bacterium]|nr:LysR family transcriptional regulator [Flavobacteriaceae bacterium]